MKTQYFIACDDYPDRVFMDIDDALDYDIRRNPECHSTKEQSFDRYENAFYEIELDDLNQDQKDWLRDQHEINKEG
jgi:hypothetical protein